VIKHHNDLGITIPNKLPKRPEIIEMAIFSTADDVVKKSLT